MLSIAILGFMVWVRALGLWEKRGVGGGADGGEVWGWIDPIKGQVL